MNQHNFDLMIRSVLIDWSKLNNNSYVREIEALREIDEIAFHKPVTFFVGENGSGKSTLIEAMAVEYGFNHEGGTLNYNFSTYEERSELAEAVTLVKGVRRAKWGYYLRAESFFNVATMEEEYAESEWTSDKLHYQSHGESFIAIAQKHFKGNGLFFLDEPEAALSPQRQLSLLLEIYKCAKNSAQFFVVTHSPILLGLPGAEILSFDEGQIHEIAYEETGSYQITSAFVNKREKMLDELFHGDDDI